MILVDSSVWIDYLQSRRTPQTNRLNEWLGTREIAVGDLILAEVLQGTRSPKALAIALTELANATFLRVVDREVAIEGARNYQSLRARGITVRKTIDTLIATRCILDDVPLLYSDRDFEPFVAHLGLRSAMDELPE